MSDDDPGLRDGPEMGMHADAVAPAEYASESVPSAAAPPRRRRALALTAVGLGAAAVAVCLVQLVSASSTGWLVALGLAVAGAICGSVALERREHRPPAIWGVALGGLASVLAIAGVLPPPDLEAHVYGYAAGPASESGEAEAESMPDGTECPAFPEPPDGYEAEFFNGSMYAADLSEKTTADQPVLAYDEAVTLASTATDDELMVMTVAAPVDVTQAAAAGSVDPPRNGVYLAVPVIYSEFSDMALSCIEPAWPSSWWVTDAGDELDLAAVSIPGYPRLEDGGEATDDTALYYDIFDLRPEDAASGLFQIYLLAPDLSQQVVYWGEVSP